MSFHHSGAAKGSSAPGALSNAGLDDKGWERSDFPILCETCLGPNPYVRMTKEAFGNECKICARPFTVFRWRPGKDARHKMTMVCQTCAKLKNVCQTCLFDLEFGLPVQVRDQELQNAVRVDMPQSDAHKEWFAEQAERQASLNDLPYGKAPPTDTLLKLARTTPYYERNRPRICSFYVKGTCNRGSECPYRHEMPTTGELSKQNIKDRFYGVNDPVANKMLRQVRGGGGGGGGGGGDATPPQDPNITTLYVGGVTPEISEDDIRGVFYAYGEVDSVRVVAASQCAFVTYHSRAAAEKAARKLQGKLVIKGQRLRLTWGRPQGAPSVVEQLAPREGGAGAGAGAGAGGGAAPPAFPAVVGQPIPAAAAAFPPPPGAMPQGAPVLYPSMNPHMLGSRPEMKSQ